MLTHPAHSEAVGDALLAHGSSFGLRQIRAKRTILERWHRTVSTPYGDIKIKVGARHGKILHMSPEFEDVRIAAESFNIPIPRVHSAAVAAWHSLSEDT